MKPELSTALCEGWQRVTEENGYLPNVCILATRVAIETLRYFGVQAQELPVGLAVLNAEYVAWEQAGRPEPMPPTAHSIGVDPDADPTDERLATMGGYMGHLVALTTDNVMIDLTLSQVNRPQKGIELGPLIVEVPGDFSTRKDWLYVLSNNRCEIAYQSRPDIGTAYKDTADWRSNHKRLVGPMIRYIKKEIDL